MQPAEQPDQQSEAPAVSSHRRWWWLAVPVIVLLAGGWWWQGRNAFHFVKAIEVQSPIAWVREDGFLSLAGKTNLNARQPCSILFHDWRGRVKWRIDLPVAEKAVFSSHRAFGVSPDGRLIATAIADGARSDDEQVLAVTWKDGKELGRAYVPAMGKLGYWISLRNDGRMMLYGAKKNELNLALLQGETVLATGRHLIYRPSWQTTIYPQPFPAPDFSYLLVNTPSDSPDHWRNTEYFTVTVEGREIKLALRFQVSDQVYLRRFENGMMMDLDGALYFAGGRRTDVTPWKMAVDSSGTSPWVAQQDGKNARIYSPATGESWPIPLLQVDRRSLTLPMTGITPDGRFVVQPNSAPRSFSRPANGALSLLAKIPPLRQPVTRWRERKMLYINLYERPGLLRQQLTCTARYTKKSVHFTYGRYPFDFFYPYLAPDAQHLLLGIAQPSEGRMRAKLLVAFHCRCNQSYPRPLY